MPYVVTRLCREANKEAKYRAISILRTGDIAVFPMSIFTLDRKAPEIVGLVLAPTFPHSQIGTWRLEEQRAWPSKFYDFSCQHPLRILTSPFTMSELFPSSLISSEVTTSLPASYTIRSLRKDDFSKGYLDCLKVLTHVGDLTVEEWNERYDEMAESKGTYYLLAVEHEGRVVGTGSLIVEKKLWVFPLFKA